MSKKIIYISLIALLSFSFVRGVFAAPNYTPMRTILPETTTLYDIGSTTRIWNKGFFDSLTVGSSTANVGGYSGKGLTIAGALPTWQEFIRHITAGASSIGSFTFGNDANSTLARVEGRSGTTGSAGALVFSTASSSALTEAMRIDEAGHVGIGSSTPLSTLSVSGNPSISPFTIASSTGQGMFSITSNGYVNIGADTNLYRGAANTLRTDDNIISGGWVRTDGNGTAAIPAYSFNNDSNTGIFSPGNNAGAIAFTTDSVERMRVDNNGLGVGTSTPGAPIHLERNTSSGTLYPSVLIRNPNATGYSFAAIDLKVNNDATWGQMLGDGSGVVFGAAGIGFRVITANPFFIQTSAVTRLTVSATGNVGIGTTTPSSLFQVTSAAATSTMACTSKSGTKGCAFIMTDENGTTCTEITTLAGSIKSKAVTCP